MEKNIFQFYVCTLLILLSLLFLPQQTQAACSNGGTCAVGGGISCNNDADCGTDGPCSCNPTNTPRPPAATATPVPAATNTPVPGASCTSAYCSDWEQKGSCRERTCFAPCNSGCCSRLDTDCPSDNTPTPTLHGDPADPTATPTIAGPTATPVPPTATPTRLPTPPGVTLTPLLPVCRDDGWEASFTWTKPDFPANPIKNFILRVNMINKWMNTKPADMTIIDNIISWTQWFLADGSDKYLITANTSEKVTVIPFRPYYDWSIQTVGTDDQKGPTVASGPFSCKPNYTMVASTPATSCYDSNGNILSECSIDLFLQEYNKQYGYSVPTSTNVVKNFNFVTGKNAYKFDKVNGGANQELIDLLDFEAWRRLKFSPNATGTPTPTPVPSTWRSLSVGIGHTCAVRLSDNKVQCWGNLREKVNAELTGISGNKVVSGNYSVQVKDTTGKITTSIVSDPATPGSAGQNIPIPSTIAEWGPILEIYAGGASACAGIDSGFKCWDKSGTHTFDGKFLDASLGGAEFCSINTNNELKCLTNWIATSTSNKFGKFSHVSSGNSHSCGINLTTSQLSCWGSNSKGQKPPTSFTSEILSVSAGFEHTCAILKSDNSIVCWGDNSQGQAPAVVPGKFQSVAAGQHHTCGLKIDNTLLCWGNHTLWDGDPQILSLVALPIPTPTATPTNTPTPSNTPEPTLTPTNTPTPMDGGITDYTKVRASDISTCALTKSGATKCWGWSYYGQVGLDDLGIHLVPTLVEPLSSGVRELSAGQNHTCATDQAGVAYCWGWNQDGQVGNTDLAGNVKSPVKVTHLRSGIKKISAGQYHTCVIDATNQVLCWGRNSTGQLGDGSDKQSYRPVLVFNSNAGVKDIATGQSHSCALMESGKMWCWGGNQFGQLGDGSLTTRLSPVEVQLSEKVKEIAVSYRYSCAVTESGKVNCWGILDNDYINYGSTPQEIAGLGSKINSIATGYSTTCVVSTSQVVKCWGALGGQNRSDAIKYGKTPVEIPTLIGNIKSVSVSLNQACVVYGDNSGVKCWGIGYLGDGTTTHSATPVDVLLN